MHLGPKMDVQLVRALRQGPAALPDDLDRLRSYMKLFGGLLEEKARELEPSWEAACAAAAEIETLQVLETTVAERAIGMSARSMGEIRNKLAIWKSLAESSEEDLTSPRNRLILSIEEDLARLSQRLNPPATG